MNLEDIKLPAGDDQQYILTTTEDGQQVLVDKAGDVIYQVADSAAAAAESPIADAAAAATMPGDGSVTSAAADDVTTADVTVKDEVPHLTRYVPMIVVFPLHYISLFGTAPISAISMSLSSKYYEYRFIWYELTLTSLAHW